MMFKKITQYLTTTKYLWLIIIVLFLFIERSRQTYIFDDYENSFIRFPKWNVSSHRLLEFEFVTNQTSALLMYTDDGGLKFIELRLVQGVLHLRSNLGSDISSLSVGKSLNDNKYHKAFIFFDLHVLTLGVDNEQNSRNLPYLALTLEQSLKSNDVFFGGLPLTLKKDLHLLSLPSVLFEPNFRGEMRNIFYLDNTNKQLISPNYLEIAGVKISEDSLNNCYLNNLCLNGGKCIYINGKTQCDCSKTNFRGKLCEEERMTAVIGPISGIITITNTIEDLSEIDLTFYFMTYHSNCLLMYIENSKNKKYLQIKLRDKSIVAAYWVEKYLKILKVKSNFADMQLHKVHIIQKGKNITLKVDHRLAESFDYENSTELILSSYPIIEIGGQNNPDKIEKAFVGILSDISLNGINILGLAASNNSHVTITGNVLIQNVESLAGKHPSSVAEPSSTNIPMDDDFGFSGSGSGSGSGCLYGDMDNCDEEILKTELPHISEILQTSKPDNRAMKECDEGSDCSRNTDETAVTKETDDFYIQDSSTIPNLNSTNNETLYVKEDAKTDQMPPNVVVSASKEKTSSMNIYLILGLIAEGIILFIILSFAIYKFTKCTSKKKSQKYNLVKNENSPKIGNDAHKVKNSHYYA